MNEDQNKTYEVDETIESIEQTVSELKKKIQELNETSVKEEPEEVVEETNCEDNSKIEEIEMQTIEPKSNNVIQESIEKIRTIINEDNISSSLDYIKSHAVKAVEIAKDEFDKVKDNPKVSETINTISETVKDFSERIIEKIPDEKKELIEDVSNKVIDGSKKIYGQTKEYLERPEVQEKISTSIDYVQDVADKSANMIVDFIQRKK